MIPNEAKNQIEGIVRRIAEERVVIDPPKILIRDDGMVSFTGNQKHISIDLSGRNLETFPIDADAIQAVEERTRTRLASVKPLSAGWQDKRQSAEPFKPDAGEKKAD